MNTEILIVEDEGLIALDLKKKLEQFGYSVPAMADSAEDALAAIERVKPSLVFMDIRLRGPQDGIETAEMIRRRFHLPVIFVTAHADRETLERARITEPFGYIVKPFHGVDFRAQIEIALWKHKMEQKLRVSESWLSLTFQNVGDALITTDREGKITFMNRPASVLTGWDIRSAQGRPLLDVFHVSDETTGIPITHQLLGIENSAAESALLDGSAVESTSLGGDAAESTSIAPRGLRLARLGASERIIVEAEISANRDGGEIFGAIVVFRDVTELRQAERQSRQLQKMSALTLMATGLGRELGESQRRMDATLKELIERTRGESLHLLWDVYERSAQQQSIVEQLITLGKTDAGQAVLVDLNEVIAGMEEQMRKALGVNRALTLKLQPQLPAIHTDPGYLRENLLRLVADARQTGPSEVLISTSTQTIHGVPHVRIAIRDNRKVLRAGAGSRVFDPYYQSGPGKRNPGFSLALVYQFVALSGGRIEVQAEPGDGSEYILTFPAAVHSLAQHAIENRTHEKRTKAKRTKAESERPSALAGVF